MTVRAPATGSVRAPALALIGLAIVACGARTPLEDRDGGGAGTGAAGTGGVGGQAGAIPVDPCDAILETGGPFTFVPSGADVTDPRLAQLGPQTTLVFRDLGQQRVGHAGFDALAAWPPALAPTLVDVGQAFDLVVGGGPLGPSAVHSQSPGADPFFLAGFDPGDGGFALAFGEATPLFVGSREDRWLAAFRVPADNQIYLYDVQPGFDASFDLDWGCASTATWVSAVPDATGFLVALASGAPFGACNGGPSGPAESLQIAHFGPYLDDTLLSELPQPEPLAFVALAPRDAARGGAWLVTRTDGSISEVLPPALAVRLDDAGQPVGDPVEVVATGDGPTPIAVAALGDRLAVAHFSTVSASHKLIVQIVLPDGSLGRVLEREVATASDDLAIVATADPDVFVVAYRDVDPRALVLARYGCVTGAL